MQVESLTLSDLLILGLCTWQIVETWHHGSIFAGRRAELEVTDGFVASLLTCMFCLSHWVAGLTTGWYLGVRLLAWQRGPEWLSLVLCLPVYAFAVTRLAQLGHDMTGLLRRLVAGKLAAGKATTHPTPPVGEQTAELLDRP